MAFTTPISALIERNANGLLGAHPHWERVRLADIAKVQSGFPFKSEHFNVEGRGMPLLRIRDIVPGATETWYDGPYEDEFVVQQGDLVIGMDGDFNHALWSGPPALLNQRVCRLLFRDEALKPWAFQALGGYLEAVNQATPSVTVKHLSSKTVGDLLLPFPSEEEEREILETLTRLLSRVDEGYRAADAALRRCHDMRVALLQELLSARDAQARIEDVGEVFVGATPSRKDRSLWGGDIPWVSSGEVAFCRISQTKESITDAALGNRSRRLHPPGTVMLAMIGEGKTRGQAAILDVAAAHNQNSAAIRLDETRMTPEFLYFSLMGMYEENRRVAEGSQQPALNGALVRAIEVPCPPLEQQRRMVDRAKTQLAAVERLESDLAEQLERSALLERALRKSAVNGGLAEPHAPEESRSRLEALREQPRVQARERVPKPRRAVLVAE